MSKRPCPWQDELERQSKMYITHHKMNESNPSYMNEIYERTNAMLFDGARRASVQSLTPGKSIIMEYEPPVPRAVRAITFENCSDMEMEDLEDVFDLPSSSFGSEGNLEMDIIPNVGRVPNLPDLLTPINLKVDSSNNSNGSIGDMNVVNDLGEENQTDDDLAAIRSRQKSLPRPKRLQMLAVSEKRDPSPVPTSSNLLKGIIHATRHNHDEAEKNPLLQQYKKYRQLSLDGYFQCDQEAFKEAKFEAPVAAKDFNGNKSMEF